MSRPRNKPTAGSRVGVRKQSYTVTTVIQPTCENIDNSLYTTVELRRYREFWISGKSNRQWPVISQGGQHV